MLRLGEQVERDRSRVRAGAGQHEQVGRPGEAVDADAAGHLALGLLHVEVAGPDDHVDGAIDSVPKASAATACAPPIR